MKKNIILIISSILATVFIAGCAKTEEKADGQQTMFSAQTEIGIYKDGKAVITFDKYSQQISRNAAGTLFRIQSDNLAKVAECKFSVTPSNGKDIETTISFTGIDAGNVSDVFKCIKTDNSKCYLWNENSKCGIIIPTNFN